MASHDLAELRRGLLRKLGREQEALGADLSSAIGLLLEIKEIDRLAEVVPGAQTNSWSGSATTY